jgi:phytoene dehydrogenase-like protein
VDLRNRSGAPSNVVDVLVVGAGLGGLGAAISLAERGLRVRLHEALAYPGGCASTFSRGGARFDAGATLCAGLGEGELFSRWLAQFDVAVPLAWPDPLMTYAGLGLTLPLWRDRARVVDDLCALPGAPKAGITANFDHQRVVGDALWPMLRDPDLLPPWSLSALARHAARPVNVAQTKPRNRGNSGVAREVATHKTILAHVNGTLGGGECHGLAEAG